MSIEDILKECRNDVDEANDRLQRSCTKWNSIVGERNHEIPEGVLNKIYSSQGQAQLLMNSKFKQFRQLLEDIEKGTVGKPVERDDLRGFWETINIQVTLVENYFKELDQLEKNHFQENNNDIEKSTVTTVKKKVNKPKPITGTKATKGVRDFIAAQRAKRESLTTGQTREYITDMKSSLNGHV